MWRWQSIDDVHRSRRAFERATTKGVVYFLLAMALLSGLAFLAGLIQLRANPNLLNQVPDAIVLTVVGILGFAFFFPWFVVTCYSRHVLMTVRELEREVERIRDALDQRGSRPD